MEHTTSTPEQPVSVDRQGAIAVVTLQRPDRLNAVNLALYRALSANIRALGSDRSVRAIVLTGAGRAFCVGADLKAHGAQPPTAAQRRRYIAAAQRANWSLQRCARPIVAAVNGHAIGAGLELALSADYVVVAREAKLRFPEIALGTFIGGGVSYTLAERVGLLKAKELLLLAEFFTADDAVAWGLANRVVAAGDVVTHALDVAARLAQHAPVSLRHAKRLLNASRDVPSRRLLHRESRALLACMATRDWAEGVRAFAEQRAPDYIGE